MMKMKLLLFLCCVLRVSAEVLHTDLAILGCSDSDGEKMFTLDDEEKWYADFKKGEGVYPQAPFIDPPIRYEEGVYAQAVGDQQTCKKNLNLTLNALKGIVLERDPPSSLMIYPRDDVEPGQENALLCETSGFFPAPVNVSWTKNGRKVTEGTSINVPYPNKDGSFTQISRLVFIPKLGDIYSCTVEHVAQEEPLTRTWDVQVDDPQPGIGPAVFCGVGLTIGLFGVAIGTFFLIKGNECS
uniref:Ig-like domain-containing protein n=1 Tax=Nothobranchius korthausae TaxID=1143690 RepID=A0A1A8EVD6_9TELE